MRIVFMGTPVFAAAILEELAQQHEVVCVYTRPDAVRGRGSATAASPVKQMAERLQLPVRTPKTLRCEEEQRALAELAPDAVCVAAYGAILPPEVLEIPRLGCLNVHASLLPRWRGAAPVERAILAGDAETGVCIMRMEEGLDTGAYCVCRTADVGDKGAEALTDELAVLGAKALLTALAHVEDGVASWTEQDESHVTYAAKVEKHELLLAPGDTAVQAARKVQASSSAHPARCAIAGRGVQVLEARLVREDDAVAEQAAALAPGQVLFMQKRLLLGTSQGALEVLRVKPEGKQAMEAKAFAAGIQNIKSGNVTWGALDVR